MSEPLRQRRSLPGVPLLAALALVLLAGATVAVAAAGPAQLGTDRLGGWVATDIFTPTPTPTDDGRDVATEPPQAIDVPGWLPSTSVLVVSVLVALVVRTLLRIVREPDDAPAAPPESDAAGDPSASHLGILRRALDDGAARLRSGQHTGVADEVVRCWEQLERTGEQRGVPRPPHQTTSEYSADLLRALGADPVATDDLLHLYHRARFSSAPLPEGSSRQAADDLASISSSLGVHERVDGQSPERAGRG